MSTPYAWSAIFPERGRAPEGAAPSPTDTYALRPPAAEADVRRRLASH
ncbi:unnamed protein product [[Actinomadura] parvosata subsp. kistnae]|nr:hypothetical protein [Nonomuraea sp. ATCC 55076]SPL99875.1 unnamed protein product [Actinomadura parvosata subsp. kistnae]